MQLTQKIRIFPDREQQTLLWILSEKCRLIYNFALSERREAYSNGTKGITYYKQQNDLPAIKKKYPEYAGYIPMLCNIRFVCLMQNTHHSLHCIKKAMKIQDHRISSQRIDFPRWYSIMAVSRLRKDISQSRTNILLPPRLNSGYQKSSSLTM